MIARSKLQIAIISVTLAAVLFLPGLADLASAQVPEEAVGGNVEDTIGRITERRDAVAGDIGKIAQAVTGTSIFDGLMSVAGKSLSFIVFAINYLLGFIGGIAFAFGGFLLQVGLELNSRLILSPIVRTGWQVTRDFANLGLVIAIIVIAFATMLRLENYSVKQLLPRLIMVALLINFSLAFAGVLIDATGVVSNFFIRQIAPNSFGGIHAFAENLASIFQMQKLHEVTDITALPKFGSYGEFSAATLGLIASVFFVAMFTITGATIMLIIAGLVIVRYIALSLLLILMPLALIAFIFPGLRENWQNWLNKFTEWLVFLPITLFFLYLTILIVTNFREDPNSAMTIIAATQAGSSGFFDKFLLHIANVLQIFGQMVVILGLLLGSLIASKSFSLTFARNITGSIIGARNKALGWLGKGAGRVAGRAAAAPAQAGARWTGRQLLGSETAKWGASQLAKIPGLRGAGSALANRIAASKELSGEEVKKYREKYLKNLPKAGDVHAFTKSFVTPEAFKPVVRAAEISELAERGKIDEVLKGIPAGEQNAVIENWLKSAKLAGVEEDVWKVKPDWGPRVGEKVEKIVPKIDDIGRVSGDSFKSAAVVAALKSDQFVKLSQISSAETKKIIKQTIKDELEELKQRKTLTEQDLDKFIGLTRKELKKQAQQRNITLERMMAMQNQNMEQLKTGKNLSDGEFNRLKLLVSRRRETNINPSWQT